MLQTPLHSEYAANGARIVEFHGWALPLQFEGILAEHRQTRKAAGVFDCSHMAEFLISGEASIRAFDQLIFSDMVALPPGRCRYSGILDPAGRLLDDCVALKLDGEQLYLVTNAGPRETVRALLEEHVPRLEDVSAGTAKIDVQGPRSRQVLLDLGLGAVGPLRFWTGTRARWQDEEIIVARAGYTGELGYELYVPNGIARALWRHIAAHPSVAPCGLGARDTLRLEAGLLLYGNDMTALNTPLEAGMDRFIRWEKDFRGKDALLAQKERGGYPVLTGIRSHSRQAPRHGFEVRHHGETVGLVTSGAFGPTVGCGVGLAYLPPTLARPGTQLTAGPRDMRVETAGRPFYNGGTCRMEVRA